MTGIPYNSRIVLQEVNVNDSILEECQPLCFFMYKLPFNDTDSEARVNRKRNKIK